MDYYERVDELECLAFLDESADYEVDMTGIYTDKVKFFVISASGCSCWDGDYHEEVYETFKDLKDSFKLDEVNPYQPSLSGVETLVKEAEMKIHGITEVTEETKGKPLDLSAVAVWLSAGSH